MARLLALPKEPAPREVLRLRWAKLPRMDPVQLRRDIDDLIDPAR